MPKKFLVAPKMVSFFTADRSRIMRRCVLIISDKMKASFIAKTMNQNSNNGQFVKGI